MPNHKTSETVTGVLLAFVAGFFVTAIGYAAYTWHEYTRPPNKTEVQRIVREEIRSALQEYKLPKAE